MLKKTFRQFRWFFKYYKKEYIICLVCILISYGTTMFPMYMIGNIADGIMDETLTLHQLSLKLLLLLIIIALNYGLGYVWEYYNNRASDEITRISRQRIFQHLLRQGPAFYAENTTGSLMGKATNDVDALQEFAGYGFMAFLDATVWPLIIYTILLFISWRITLLAVLPLPLLIFISRRLGTRLYQYYAESQESFDHMNEEVLEGISGIRVVRAYHLEEQQKSRFAERSEDLYRKNMRAVRYSQMYGPAALFLSGISLAIALGMGLYEISAARLTVGKLITFTMYLTWLTWPMMAIGEFIVTAEQASASSNRIDQLLNQKPDVEDASLQLPMPVDSSIRFHNYSFEYPDNKGDTPVYALQNISFYLKDGQTLGLVGPVGCGKSTLLRQLMHFYPLEEDQIIIGSGSDLSEINRSDLREKIAYVPQTTYLFSRTVKENILLGASDEALQSGWAEKRLEEVLDIADLRKDLPSLPKGIDSLAGEKGIALSGGQKQRISIARALMKDADILIMDDCLSAVDAITETHILKALRKDRSGRTTLISAHRLSAVRDADLILVMDKGKIIDRGTHEELIERGGWYAAQYQQQQLESLTENADTRHERT